MRKSAAAFMGRNDNSIINSVIKQSPSLFLVGRISRQQVKPEQVPSQHIGPLAKSIIVEDPE